MKIGQKPFESEEVSVQYWPRYSRVATQHFLTTYYII